MKKILVLLLLFFLIGCGGGSNADNEEGSQGNDDNSEPIALWEENENGCLTKINVAYDDKFEYTSGNYKSLSYTWYCLTYNDQPNVYVSLSFDNNSDGSTCYRFDSEYVSNGIC